MARSPRKTPRETIPVRILAHHPIVARYLNEVLRRQPQIESFTIVEPLQLEGSSGQRGLVCVIDSGTVPLPLAGYLRSIKASAPEAKILVLGISSSQEELSRLLLLGIDGFIPYEEIDGSLVSGVRAIWEGHLWVSAAALEHFTKQASHVSEMRSSKRRKFSGREREIIELLDRRQANKEIAEALGIKERTVRFHLQNERTVRFHLQNIFSKLGVHDRHSVVDMLRSKTLSEALDEKGA